MATENYTMEEIIRNVILRYGINNLFPDDPRCVVYTNLEGELISNNEGQVICPELESKIRKWHRYDEKTQIYLIFYKEFSIPYTDGSEKTFIFSTCITSNDISFSAIIQEEGQKIARVFSWNELKEIRPKNAIRENGFHSMVGDPIFILRKLSPIAGYSFRSRNNYTNIPIIYFHSFIGLVEPLNDIINKKYVSFSNSWGSKRSEKPYGRKGGTTDDHRVKAIRGVIEMFKINECIFDDPCRFLYTNLDGTLKNGSGEVMPKYEEAAIRTSHYLNNGETIYAIFFCSVSEKLEKGNSYKMDFSTCITSDVISIRGIEIYNGEETPFCSYYTLAWEDLMLVRCLNVVTKEHPNLLEADPVFNLLEKTEALAFYIKTGEEIVVPMFYFAYLSLENFFNDVLNPQRIEDVKKYLQYNDELQTYETQKDYQKLLETIEKAYNEILTLHLSYSDYYSFKAIAFAGLQRKEEAIREFERLKEYMEEIDEKERKSSLHIFLKTRALIYALDKKYYLAAQDNEAVVAIGKETQRPEIVEEYREKQKENYQQFLTHFKEQPLKDRNIITIAKTSQLFKSDHLTLLNIDNLPAVNFPMSHPKINHTYIAHPYKTDSYLPIENYDYELLNDRLNEFFYFLQCLGATSITFETVEEESKEKKKHSNTKVGTKMSVGYNSIMNSSLCNYLKKERTQTFNPTKKPYIPDGLVWYPNEFTWQRLAQQRLNGNFLTHNEVLSSSQTQTLSSTEIEEVNAELKMLFTSVELGVPYQGDIKQNKDFSCRISVEFKPMNEFSEEPVAI
jgi:hypothetical protein